MRQLAQVFLLVGKREVNHVKVSLSESGEGSAAECCGQTTDWRVNIVPDADRRRETRSRCQTWGVDFGTVIWIIVLVVAPIAAVLFAGAFGLLEQLGPRGAGDRRAPAPRPAPAPNSPAAVAEREADIRQLVQARHDRAVARGEPPLDVQAEVERLMALDPAAQPEADQQDAALREEVRQLVVARNERRAARGEAPLDVEEEVDRQLRDLT